MATSSAVHKICLDSSYCRTKDATLPQLYTSLDDNHHDSPGIDLSNIIIDDRRNFIKSVLSMGLLATSAIPTAAIAEDNVVVSAAAAAAAVTSPVQVVAIGDAKKLFTEGRALEAQGNILAAQRLYIKVTKISPRFLYGWANLSNTLVAQGQLNDADQTYTKAINLCEENLKEAEESFGIKRCDDLYLLLLNRGSVRLNNGMSKEALTDLQRANTLEAQGNILAAQRLYIKVTKISPRFLYGWANLSNTLVAQGQLNDADQTYTKAINLCEENLKEAEESFGIKRCDDLYLLLLNRGSVRLNNGMSKEALTDLQRANTLRARPDAIILQNLARGQELNSFYSQSDKSYTTAISMTANEVNPFWLRSSMVKYQLGDVNGAMDLMKRVENRFPEAPEVRAAYAVLLLAKGDEDAARRKFLEIPDRQRVKYADGEYLDKIVAWPSAMKEGLSTLIKAIGDSSQELK